MLRAAGRGVALAALAALSIALAAAPAPPRAAALSRVVDAATAQGFAGQVLVADRSDVWLDRSTGLADRARGIAHRPDEIWRWASVTKQLSALLVMRQVDAGRVQLDDTLRTLLPGFNGPTAATVTVRQLLQHTAGLPNPDDSPLSSAGVPGFYLRDGPGLEASALAYCSGPVKRPPGERFEYNNCDTLVLGALLARLEGKPFAEIVRTQITGPLGLSTVALNEGSARTEAIAVDALGQPVAQPKVATFGAAGALEGSAMDLLAFDRALLSNTLLSSASTATMWTGEPRWGYVALGAWAFEARLAGCTAPTRLIERRGDVGGIQVRNVIAPDAGIVVIVFTNAAEFAFGEIWQGRGPAHDLLAAALCG